MLADKNEVRVRQVVALLNLDVLCGASQLTRRDQIQRIARLDQVGLLAARRSSRDDLIADEIFPQQIQILGRLLDLRNSGIQIDEKRAVILAHSDLVGQIRTIKLRDRKRQLRALDL